MGGSSAFSFTGKGVELWAGFDATIKPTTVLRFKLKAEEPVERLEIQIWSTQKKDNGRFYVSRPPVGRWIPVEIPASELKFGWDRKGEAMPVGERFDNFKVLVQPKEGGKLLLDDFEILE